MYKLTTDPDVIHRTADNTFIPRTHKLWLDYEAWLSLGNIPAPVHTLEDLKQRKITALCAACREMITSGFDSHALGTLHHYPLSQTDQANLQAAHTSALANQADTVWTILIQCQGAGESVAVYKPHTAAQVMQTVNEIIGAKESALAKLASLTDQVSLITVDASTTLDQASVALEQIVW